MRKLVTILVLFLGLPAVLCAQKQRGQWSDLSALSPGQGIKVVDSNMRSHGGQFVTVNEEGLTLKEHDSDVTIRREDVARVSTSSSPRRGEHAVIGLVVGGLIGAGIGAAAGSKSNIGGRGLTALVGVVIGAPIGALVGALSPAHRTVYRSATATPSH